MSRPWDLPPGEMTIDELLDQRDSAAFEWDDFGDLIVRGQTLLAALELQSRLVARDAILDLAAEMDERGEVVMTQGDVFEVFRQGIDEGLAAGTTRSIPWGGK